MARMGHSFLGGIGILQHIDQGEIDSTGSKQDPLEELGGKNKPIEQRSTWNISFTIPQEPFFAIRGHYYPLVGC